MSKNIEKLIVKFLSKEANFDELQQLEIWISNPKNEALFLEYIKTNALINKAITKKDTVKAKANIIQRINKAKTSSLSKTKKHLWYRYAAAASIVLIISLSIFLNKETPQIEFTEPVIVNNQIKKGSDKAILTLEDGSEVTLLKGKSYNVENAISNGVEITYKATKKTKKEIKYNYLTVPRGGQYQITLSDNTKVWLNSDSQIKYPINFIKGETRQVDLVYGEAYFDVSPSTENSGASFKVFNKNQEIKVLGTEFNVKAYKDEGNIYTTLVEGKVVVNKKHFIYPGEQTNLNVETGLLTITNVDVGNEIAWKEGVFNFENKNLKDIMIVLSRWYDIDVVFDRDDLENQKFIGSLKKNYSIENILSTMKNANIINSFEINNKSVTIK